MMAGVDERWMLLECGAAPQAGRDCGEVARALGPGQEAGLQMSEAWGELRIWRAGVWSLVSG